MARSRKNKVNAIDALVEAKYVYGLWISSVIAECGLHEANGEILRNVLLNKPPAAFVIENYIQTRFSLALEQKDALLESVKGTKDREQIKRVIEQMESIDKVNNIVWTPPA